VSPMVAKVEELSAATIIMLGRHRLESVRVTLP